MVSEIYRNDQVRGFSRITSRESREIFPLSGAAMVEKRNQDAILPARRCYPAGRIHQFIFASATSRKQRSGMKTA
jgi:hypothetical protein